VKLTSRQHLVPRVSGAVPLPSICLHGIKVEQLAFKFVLIIICLLLRKTVCFFYGSECKLQLNVVGGVLKASP